MAKLKRQIKWQRKQRALGKCAVCGDEAADYYCAHHASARRNGRKVYMRGYRARLRAAL